MVYCASWRQVLRQSIVGIEGQIVSAMQPNLVWKRTYGYPLHSLDLGSIRCLSDNESLNGISALRMPDVARGVERTSHLGEY